MRKEERDGISVVHTLCGMWSVFGVGVRVMCGEWAAVDAVLLSEVLRMRQRGRGGRDQEDASLIRREGALTHAYAVAGEGEEREGGGGEGNGQIAVSIGMMFWHPRIPWWNDKCNQEGVDDLYTDICRGNSTIYRTSAVNFVRIMRAPRRPSFLTFAS